MPTTESTKAHRVATPEHGHRARERLHWFAWPVGITLLAACGPAHQGIALPPSELPAVQIRTRPVQLKRFTSAEEVVGTVRARFRATLEAKTSGRIADMPIVLGQRVKAGELLARLDAPEIRARLDQAEASLQQAERDAKRLSSLLKQQAVSRAESEAAETRSVVAKGVVAEARALMAYVEIHAPFDAVVTRKGVEVGDQAAPGKPLVEIEDPSHLQLEADLPESLALRVSLETPMAIRVEQSGRELAGTVAEIAPIADWASRTVHVKVDLPDRSGLISGQFTRLIVPVGESTFMSVPASAVIQRGQMEIVFAVENQRARLHLVKTGQRVNDAVEILSGLDPGDLVVIENPQQLREGQAVEGL